MCVLVMETTAWQAASVTRVKKLIGHCVVCAIDFFFFFCNS